MGVNVSVSAKGGAALLIVLGFLLIVYSMENVQPYVGSTSPAMGFGEVMVALGFILLVVSSLVHRTRY